MGMMRYTFDYNGMRYTVDAPEGTSPADLQRAVSGGAATQKAAPKAISSEVAKRQAELAAEEKAARDELARATKTAEEYRSTFIGKALAAPYELFGAKSTSERRLEEFGQETKETIDRINRERAFLQREGRVAPTPTVGERAVGALKSIPRGAIEGGSQFLGTLGIGGEEGEQAARSMQERGKRAVKSLGLEGSETAEFDPIQRNLEAFGGGLGSLVPYVATEVIGRKAAPLTKAAPYVARSAQALLGSGQGATQAREQMEEFEKQTGQKIDPTTRKLVQAGGATIGLTELLPIGRMVDTLPGPIKAAVTKRITDIITQTGVGKLAPEAARAAIRETVQAIESRAVGRIATRGILPEALQEGGAQLAQNVLERSAYNPEQALMEGVKESAIIGGLVGGTVRGGFEVARSLGQRAATNRQKAFEQLGGETLQEFDINVGSKEDPTQLTRQRVQILSPADQNGNVLVARPDGTRYQASLAELERMRAPTEGIRAVAIPDTLSRPALTERFTAALGNVEPDQDMASYIKNVTTTLNNNMAMGTPEATDTFLQRQQNSLRKSRIPEEARIARMLVLDEAVKAHNDYLNLVTAPPEGAPPPPSLTETLATKAADLADVQQKRMAALDAIANDPNQIDKVETFEALMVQNGLDVPTPTEVATLHDAMRVEFETQRDALRAESEVETAAGKKAEMSRRQRLVDRANIIERVLYDDRIPAKEKADRINAKMQGKGLGPLSRYELERIAGVNAANAVFGPEGEYTQRRQAILDQVLADPTITDKYRGYAEALDQFPELGDPTPEEIRALRGDTAALEAQIAPSGEPVPLTQLPAEPGAPLEEGSTVGQIEEVPTRDKSKRDAAAREAINEQIKAEEAKLKEEPNKGTPAARAAIENIKALKAQRDALRAAAAVPTEEAPAPAVEEVPVTEEAALEAPASAELFEDYANGRPVVRTQDGTPPKYLYRVMSRSEFEAAQQAGVFENPREGRVHASGSPLTEYIEPGSDNVLVRFDYSDSDGWRAKHSGAGVVAIADSVPFDRATVMGEGSRSDITAATEQAAPAQPAPTAATQTINNPEEDIAPVEEQRQADPETIEGTFPASLNRPRAEAIGFAADLEQRVKSIWNRGRRRFEGKYKTAYDYSRALAASYGVTKLPPNLDVARKFELLESRKIGGQMRLKRWYLDKIEDKIKELGLDPQDVGVYLWARSAPGRNALVRERNGVENGSGLSDAQARVLLDKLELEGLGPKLREVAKLHDALVDYVGAQRVKAGLLSRAEWKAMRKAQPFYTPLKGYALAGDMQVDGDPDPHSDEERGIAAKNGVRVSEVLKARGRESMPFNPLFNLMNDAQSAIARIEQNKVKQTFLDSILSDPESHKDLVTVYTPKKETHASGLVTLPKLGPNGPVNMNLLASQKNPELMIVKKDGKSYFIEFAPTPAGNALYRLFGNMSPRLLDQIMNAGYSFRAGNMQMRIPSIAEVGNFLKSMKTRYSPVFTFGISWLRDFSEALATARAAQGIKGGPAEGTKLFKRTLRNIASVRSGMGTISDYLRGKDPTTAEGELMTLLFDQFLEDGGAVGHAQIMDAETYAQDTAKTIRRYAAAKRANPIAAALLAKDTVAGALDHASQLFDLHARFATYRAALEVGISREDAAALALDSTLDMTRRGEMSSLLDNWSFFFSPTVGGARKLLAQGRYSTLARRLFTKLVGAGMLLYLFNRFGPGAGDDDEDGRPNILEVNNATAQTRVILRYGPGINQYVSIPTAFGIGFFNYTGGQLMAMFLQDIEPMEAATNIVTGFVSLASPIKAEGTEGLSAGVDLLVPDIGLQPLRDLVANRNAFGSQIYTPQGEYSTTPKSELGREETGEVWKFIAKGINSLFGGTSTVESAGAAQPEQYRYIAQQLLGGAYGFGRDTLNLLTGEAKPDQTLARRVPIISTYFGKGGEFAPMNKFYEDYDRLKALYAVYNNENRDNAEWEENKANFPIQASPRVMDAFGDAQSELRKIDNDYKDGQYQSRDAMLNARTEVYKKFNRIYADAKRAD